MQNSTSVARAAALYESGRQIAIKAYSVKNVDLRDKYYQDAKSLLLRAMLLQEVHLDRGHPDLARTRISLAHLIYRFSETDQAEAFALAEYTLAEQEKYCSESWEVVETLLNIASLYPGSFSQRLRRKEYVERAVDIIEKYDDNTNVQIVSAKVDTYTMMVGCLNLSELDEKIKWERRALELLQTYQPERRKAIFRSHKNLALLEHLAENYPMEIAELEIAIKILREELLSDDPRNTELLERLETAKQQAEAACG